MCKEQSDIVGNPIKFSIQGGRRAIVRRAGLLKRNAFFEVSFSGRKTESSS